MRVLRQIEIYDTGVCLKYSITHLNDEFGRLSEKPLDDDDWAEYRIPASEFEKAWSSNHALNEHV